MELRIVYRRADYPWPYAIEKRDCFGCWHYVAEDPPNIFSFLWTARRKAKRLLKGLPRKLEKVVVEEYCN